MKKPILIPLFASSVVVVVVFGCQEQSTDQASTVMEKKVEQAQWVGTYQGTTPCMGCISRCQDCPGMAVDLTLNQDMSYILRRESLSGHNEIENLTGVMRFRDAEHTQLELLNVKNRNLMWVDIQTKCVEIREDVTGNAYQIFDDFRLENVNLAVKSDS